MESAWAATKALQPTSSTEVAWGLRVVPMDVEPGRSTRLEDAAGDGFLVEEWSRDLVEI